MLCFTLFFNGIVFAEVKKDGEVLAYFFTESNLTTKLHWELRSENQEVLKGETKESFLSINLAFGEYVLSVTNEQGLTKTIPFYTLSGEQTRIMYTFSKNLSLEKLEISEPQRKIKKKLSENLLKKIKFKLKDQTTGAPISNATIYIKGTGLKAETSSSGVAELLIGVKSADVTLVHPEYSAQTIKNIDFSLKSIIPLKVLPIQGELSELVVLAPSYKGSQAAMMNVRKNSSGLKDLMGASEIKKNGDSSAASALSRITGLSLVDGKYIYVRGLGERYSSTKLNGLVLPSPDPSRRVVPLDMFPTGLVESLSVQKSYEPSAPAEFGGGVVEVTTQSMPSKFTAGLSMSTGVNDLGTLRGNAKGLFAKSDRLDFLGVDAGLRSLPLPVKKLKDQKIKIKKKSRRSKSGQSKKELVELAKSFPVNYDVNEKSLSPNYSVSAHVGDQVSWKSLKLGGQVKASLSHDYDRQGRLKQNYIPNADGGTQKSDSKFIDETEHMIQTGVLLSTGIEFLKSQKLSYTGLLSRSTVDMAEILDQESVNSAEDNRVTTSLYWKERQIKTHHLRGSHFLTQHKITPRVHWDYGLLSASNFRPDQKKYVYEYDPFTEDYLFAENRAYGNSRLYGDLEDQSRVYNLGLDIPLETSLIGRELKLNFKFGYLNQKRKRTDDVIRFFLQKLGKKENAYALTDKPNKILSHVGEEGFRLSENTTAEDNYTATHNVESFYFNASVFMGWRKKNNNSLGIELYFGGRDESSKLTFQSFERTSTKSNLQELEDNRFLPVYGLKLVLPYKNSLRLAWSRTISRPDFKEFSESESINDEEKVIERGNKNLKVSDLSNFDLRWDWYLSKSNIISASYFRKHFKNPIEAVGIPASNPYRTYINTPEAELYGYEFEFRADLKSIWSRLQGFKYSGNLSWMRSEVRMTDVQRKELTHNVRPLQGQSKFLGNMALGYTLNRNRTFMNLIFSIYGSRIQEVGTRGLDDIYEQPYSELDFVLQQKLGSRMSMGFKVRNITNSERVLTQGTQRVQGFTAGRSYSLGIKWKI